MSVHYGEAIYEISKDNLRRERLGFKLLATICLTGMVIVDVLLILAGFDDISSIRGGWPAIAGVIAFVSAILAYGAYGSYRLAYMFNRFGIYENGISPAKKPLEVLSLKMPSKENLFIPYGEIESISLEGTWIGKTPKSPYTLSIKTRGQGEVDIHVMDIIEYIGVDLRELRRIYDILHKVEKELEKNENRRKAKMGTQVVIPKSEFEVILTKDYGAYEVPRKPRYPMATVMIGLSSLAVGLVVLLGYSIRGLGLSLILIGAIVSIVGSIHTLTAPKTVAKGYFGD